VLASAEPVEPTLRALRAAGYSPVQQSATGETVVERVEPRRAPEPGGRRVRIPEPPDAAAVARRLAGGADEPDPLEFEPFLDAAAALDDVEVRLLGYAIEHHLPVCIEYVNAAGNLTERVIEPIQLIFDALHAWCRLRDDERVFRLGRILSVSPA
jgi:predicted DNA-binding transcriptional regulator YafY